MRRWQCTSKAIGQPGVTLSRRCLLATAGSSHPNLAGRRAAERRTLVRALRGARLRRLLDGWAGELSALADSARSADGAAWSAGALAPAGVARAHRRVVRGGTAISESSPPQDLHVLRKRCKELRYALEMFAPVLDDTRVGTAIKDLKSLQDVLGRFQDSHVRRSALRGFARFPLVRWWGGWGSNPRPDGL